jgi:hypothetical protein
VTGAVKVTDAATTRLGGGWTASSTARRIDYTSRKSSRGLYWFHSLGTWVMMSMETGGEVPGIEADVAALVATLGGAVGVSMEETTLPAWLVATGRSDRWHGGAPVILRAGSVTGARCGRPACAVPSAALKRISQASPVALRESRCAGGRCHCGRRVSRCRRPTGNQREGWPSADMPCSAAYATSFNGARSI